MPLLLLTVLFLSHPKYIELCNVESNSAIISYAQDASPSVMKSAERLQNYYHRVTGKEPKIQIDTPKLQGKIILWLGPEPLPENQREKLKDHAFLISFSQPGKIVLAGASNLAIDYAVSEFAERFLGIRWLMPSELGTHFPNRETLRIASGNIFQKPAFKFRKVTGARNTTVRTWFKNHRVGGTMAMHHNLLNLFPPETYTKSHPEFFPIENGIRRIPANNTIYRWQPCFSADGIVEEAVKNIRAYFDQYPDRKSYSLGINDSDRFCKCDKCLPKFGKPKNTYGFQDVSDLYYNWANQVVEGVLKTHPDKWFGVLAYLYCGDPPEHFDLHPRIVPFMTYDRSKWIKSKFRRTGKKLTKKYLGKSHLIGWYDYIYGAPYLLPRVYFHRMADTYRWAAKQKDIQYIYAESSPNFGEGPKLYLAFKLFWDPYLDVDKTLNEWYELAVGHEAAKPLKAYYQHWEHFWTKRVLKSEWLTEKGQWMWFGEPDYLQLIDYKEIKESRALLERTVSLTKTKKQKQRAEIILKAFEYYEASAYSYLGLVEKRPLPGKNLEFFVEHNNKRYQLVKEYESNPLLKHNMRFDKKRTLNFDLLNWAQ